MRTGQDPRAATADVARQARDLLALVRDSRWPGFEPEPIVVPIPGPRREAAALRLPMAASAATATRTPPAKTLHPWDSLEQVARTIASCTKCPLHLGRKKTVPGEGNARARLMFVGEAPGADEDAQGRPFVGAAGRLLDRMIVAMGLARGEVFIANVLKCRPPENRDPLPEEVAACLPFLEAQIALVDPEVVCTLGRHPAHALLGRKDALGVLRGRFHDFRGTPLLPTYHPSYLLRTPADKPAAWKDLRMVMQLLELPLPDASRAGVDP